MVLYVDLGRAMWKSSGTPQHSKAFKIGFNAVSQSADKNKEKTEKLQTSDLSYY